MRSYLSESGVDGAPPADQRAASAAYQAVPAAAPGPLLSATRGVEQDIRSRSLPTVCMEILQTPA